MQALWPDRGREGTSIRARVLRAVVREKRCGCGWGGGGVLRKASEGQDSGQGEEFDYGIT